MHSLSRDIEVKLDKNISKASTKLNTQRSISRPKSSFKKEGEKSQ